MSKAVVGEACEGAILEAEKGAIGRTPAVPGAGRSAQAAHPPAAQETDDVDLVRRLVEDHAAALGGNELLGAARAIEEIREVERSDHPHRADLAARDDRAGAANGLIEAVAVADDQPDAGAARRLDHLSAISEAQRHRLLDKHVLAGLGRELCMLRVKLVWRGDVNRLDRVVAAKLVDALISWRREFGAEAGTRLGAGIGRAGEPH